MEVDSPKINRKKKKKKKKEAHIPYHKNGTKQTNMLWMSKPKINILVGLKRIARHDKILGYSSGLAFG